MKNKQDGFSIIMAMFLVLAMVIAAQYVLSYIIPFSQDTKGIENSAKAYYESTKALELATYQIKDKKIALDNATGENLPSGNTGSVFNIEGKSNVIPIAGKGNSDFDEDFNQLSLYSPIQLVLTDNSVSLGNIILKIKIPNIDGDDTTTERVNLEIQDDNNNYLYHDTEGNEITTMGEIPIIGWSLSGEDNTLTGTKFITLDDINNGGFNKYLGSLSLKGETLDETENITISNFYTDTSSSGIGNCEATEDGKCVLKFFLINKLKMSNDTEEVYPYLEYRITLPSGVSLFTKETNISAEGKSYGFKKVIEKDIPQEATNAAFDFTIMQ